MEFSVFIMNSVLYSPPKSGDSLVAGTFTTGDRDYPGYSSLGLPRDKYTGELAGDVSNSGHKKKLYAKHIQYLYLGIKIHF